MDRFDYRDGVIVFTQEKGFKLMTTKLLEPKAEHLSILF